MSTLSFSPEQIVHIAKFSPKDLDFINIRQRDHNRLEPVLKFRLLDQLVKA